MTCEVHVILKTNDGGKSWVESDRVMEHIGW